MSGFTVLNAVSITHNPNWSKRSTDIKIEIAKEEHDFTKIKQIIDTVLGHTDKPYIEFKAEEEAES